MQHIASVKNPAVVAAKALLRKQAREESGLFLCDGEHMVLEALNAAGQTVQTLFVEESRIADFEPLLRRYAVPEVYAVPPQVMESLSQVKTPQGVAAVARIPAQATLDRLGERLVLLENVQDPGNVGTILRTADAAGFHGCVLTPGCADPFSPKTLRATMGSVFRVPTAAAQSASWAANALRERGYALLAAELNGEDFYQRAALPQKLCLMIGNEGAGLTPEAVAAATHRYRLPMRGGAESLNAAIAAAVFMFDLANRG